MRESSSRTMRWVKWLYGQAKSGRFLTEVLRSARVPSRVANEELLARYCDLKAIRSKIKPKIFYSSSLTPPLELSVDRVLYCDPRERCKRETESMGKARGFVTLTAGDVRKIERTTVVSDKPPPEHAAIVLGLSERPVPTLAAIKAEADLFAQFDRVCVDLAKMAKLPP